MSPSRHPLQALFLALALLLPARHTCADMPPSPDVLFEQARAAHVAADYRAAEDAYRALIDQGYATKETWYNLGNTLFHGGRLGEAILAYRRAWLLAPRDADSIANLTLAAQRTGATLPDPTWWGRFAHEASASVWRQVMLAAYWIAALIAIGAVLVPASRRFAKPALVAALAVAGLAALGWSYWKQWHRHPEAVVLHGEHTVRYEPRGTATPYFALAEGSIVRIEDTFDAWMKISADAKQGWIERGAVEPVYPWQPAGMR
jgi:tetratricopeptide (TPR) repeat protein